MRKFSVTVPVTSGDVVGKEVGETGVRQTGAARDGVRVRMAVGVDEKNAVRRPVV